ncbi:phosphoesterase PA-phosphatase related protein [Paenibacillus curdlanolyticus YK9]|uniref:Phosphoesterase PA-phosphatase related protein n=1 Tax=Paenibacillus curdlanolyticus YK9 TaxID=717606 RepID=E0I3Y7_9BACL|nr:phosphatase PAP2 family protein [Paenibacillus curdlanolyticus]EFM13001.1 phosphoesterase PA-phosphatase related protein [Paenibacillus curdlanolyticus YK9]
MQAKPHVRIREKWLPFGIALLFLIGFGGIASKVREEGAWIQSFDERVMTFARKLETPLLSTIMKGITHLGDSWPVVGIGIVALIVLALLRYRIELLFFIVVNGGSAWLNTILKQLFQRTRPMAGRLVEAVGYSFPSGHSMAAFTLYGVLAYLLWKHMTLRGSRAILAGAGTLLVLLIGFSRIYVGVHYPSDVAGAYMASGAWLCVAIGLFRLRQARVGR